MSTSSNSAAVTSVAITAQDPELKKLKRPLSSMPTNHSTPSNIKTPTVTIPPYVPTARAPPNRVPTSRVPLHPPKSSPVKAAPPPSLPPVLPSQSTGPASPASSTTSSLAAPSADGSGAPRVKPKRAPVPLPPPGERRQSSRIKESRAETEPSYVAPDSSSEDGGSISDGDPPGFEGAATADGHKVKRRSFEELEDITFASPQSFAAMAFSIAESRGMRLVITDDKTNKTFSAYMHLKCVHRKSGCPFVLKLIRAKEGGWELRSYRAGSESLVDMKYRSTYTCHHPVAGSEQAQSSKRTTTTSHPSPGTRPRAAKQRSLTPLSNSHLPHESQRESLAGKAPTAASSRPTTTNGTGHGATNGASTRSGGAAPSVSNGTRPSLQRGGETSPTIDPYQLDRALAPPFARSQNLQGQIHPALSNSHVNGGTLSSNGQLYPRSTPRPPSPSLSAPPGIDGKYDPRYGPLPSPRTSSFSTTTRQHSGTGPSSTYLHTVYSPQPPPQLPPAPRPLFPSNPVAAKDWSTFLTQLDPELVPLAQHLASSSVACTLSSFMREDATTRNLLIKGLDDEIVGKWSKVKLARKMEKRGEEVWEAVKGGKAGAKVADGKTKEGSEELGKGKEKESTGPKIVLPPLSTPAPINTNTVAATTTTSTTLPKPRNNGFAIVAPHEPSPPPPPPISIPGLTYAPEPSTLDDLPAHSRRSTSSSSSASAPISISVGVKIPISTSSVRTKTSLQGPKSTLSDMEVDSDDDGEDVYGEREKRAVAAMA